VRSNRCYCRDEAMVIATGGSIVSEPETFDLLLSTCHVIG
jgi:shikimate kinase